MYNQSSSEWWTISSRMKWRLETTEILFYERIRRLPWTGHMSNEEVFLFVLFFMETKRTVMLRIRKRKQTSWKNNEERGGEFDTHKTYLRKKKDWGRLQATYLMCLCEWIAHTGWGGEALPLDKCCLEVVKDHNNLCPEETCLIEEVEKQLYIFFSFLKTFASACTLSL